MKIITSIIALFICFSINAQWNKNIKGNGTLKTETRTVSNFDAISIAGSFNVELVEDNEGEITITADENLLEYIISETEKSTLKIKTKDHYNIRSTKIVKIKITFKDFEKLALAGSGNIFSKNILASKSFKVSMAGSGNIKLEIDNNTTSTSIAGSGNLTLEGETTSLKTSLAGSGNLNAYNLKASIVNISIAGSGNVKVHVENEIHASIVGSGDVIYTGNPTIEKVSKIGTGTFKNKN